MRILPQLEQDLQALDWWGPVMQFNKFVDLSMLSDPTRFWDKRSGEFIRSQDFEKVYGDLDMDYYIVKTKKNLLPVAMFSVVQGEDGVADGIVGFWYVNENVLSIRKRPDGLIGIEALDTNADTRLSEKDIVLEPQKYERNLAQGVAVSSNDDADFGSGGKHFICYKLNIDL